MASPVVKRTKANNRTSSAGTARRGHGAQLKRPRTVSPGSSHEPEGTQGNVAGAQHGPRPTFPHLKKNVYFERERERERERGEGTSRGGAERERIPSRFSIVSTEPDAGLDLTNREIMTRTETKGPMLNRLSHRAPPTFPRLTQHCHHSLRGPIHSWETGVQKEHVTLPRPHGQFEAVLGSEPRPLWPRPLQPPPPTPPPIPHTLREGLKFWILCREAFLKSSEPRRPCSE